MPPGTLIGTQGAYLAKNGSDAPGTAVTMTKGSQQAMLAPQQNNREYCSTTWREEPIPTRSVDKKMGIVYNLARSSL
jgi:hypothetical protein